MNVILASLMLLAMGSALGIALGKRRTNKVRMRLLRG